MNIIYNDIIPFEGFVAINLFGNLFVRTEYKTRIKTNNSYLKKLINHESIHTEQMKDFARFLPKCMQLYIGGFIFYICYICEWLFRLFFTKDCFSHKAYRNISFEQEAYNNESNLTYLDIRKTFALWKK